MENKQYKILKYLYDSDEGDPKNISPLIISFFTIHPDRQTLDRMYYANKMHFLLGKMRNEKWIIYSQLGQGIQSTQDLLSGKIWFDSEKCFLFIRTEGRRVYEDETLRRSQIKTNKSVKKLNKNTKQTQHISTLLTIISTVFIIVTGVKACNDKTEEKIEAITTEMKKNRKTFDSIGANLNSLSKALKDTL